MMVSRLLIGLLLIWPALARAEEAPAPAMVSTCFVPGPTDCADEIATAIDSARSTVLVQAYWLTSLPIMHALAAAKRRGVDVKAILERDEFRSGRILSS